MGGVHIQSRDNMRPLAAALTHSRRPSLGHIMRPGPPHSQQPLIAAPPVWPTSGGVLYVALAQLAPPSDPAVGEGDAAWPDAGTASRRIVEFAVEPTMHITGPAREAGNRQGEQ